MAYQTIDGVRVWGIPDEGALSQAKTCAEKGNVVQTLLMADHHMAIASRLAAWSYTTDSCSPPVLATTLASRQSGTNEPSGG